MSKRLFAIPAKAQTVSKQISKHTFSEETGDEYKESGFNGHGGYLRRKRQKLQNRDAVTRSEGSSLLAIFAGVVATVQGYTMPSEANLRRAVVMHGGGFLDYATGKTEVTHMIASNLSHAKRNEWKRYRVVTPEWVVESLKAKKLLDWRKFRLFAEEPGQRQLDFAAAAKTAVPAVATRVEDQPSSYGRLQEPFSGSARATQLSRNEVIPDSEGEEDDLPPPAQRQTTESFQREQEALCPSYQRPFPSSGSTVREEEEDEIDLVPTSAQPRGVSFRDDDDLSSPPAKRQRTSPCRKHEEIMNSRDSSVSEPDSDSDEERFLPTDDEGEKRYVPEGIIGERREGRGKYAVTKYKVLWKGYSARDCTWEPADTLREDLGDDLDAMVEDFHSSRSSKKKSQRSSAKQPETTHASWKSRKRQEKIQLGIAKDHTLQSQTFQKSDTVVVKATDEAPEFRLSQTEVRKSGPSFQGRSPQAQQRKLSFAVEIQVKTLAKTEDTTVPEEPPRPLPRSLPVFGVPSLALSQENAATPLDDDKFKSAAARAPFAAIPLPSLPPVADQVTRVLTPPKTSESPHAPEKPDVERFTESQLASFISDGLPDGEWKESFDEKQVISSTPEARFVTQVPRLKCAESASAGEQLDLQADPPDHPPFTQRPPSPALGRPIVPSTPPLSSPPKSKVANERTSRSFSQGVPSSIPERPSTPSIPVPSSPPVPNYQTTPKKQLPPVDSSPEPRTIPRQETAEEFNKRLLADPKVREASVLNPGFLKKFYEESRLHHLSTWKSDLRAQLHALALASSQRAQPKPRKRRYILHVDFDCFFAAVSTRDRPGLKDKPVAVSHGNSVTSTSSEIASCNYAARAFGVKNGMWMARAKELCPGLVVLPYNFPKYEEASRAFYEVVLSIGAEHVQAVSVDEVLLDVSNRCAAEGKDMPQIEERVAQRIGAQIREQVFEKTDCEVSVGIGPNVMVARLALRKAKPAGLSMLSRSSIQPFLDPLNISAFPGVGPSIVERVRKHLGAELVKDVKQITKERLKQFVGPRTGEKLYEFCRGIDNTPVGDPSVVKRSISVDVNWGVRFENQEQAEQFVKDLAEEVEKRMRKERVVARNFTLKIAVRDPGVPFATEKFLGSGKCQVINRSISLGDPTNNKAILESQAITHLRLLKISPGELRGLGFLVNKLEEDKGIVNGQRKLNFAVAEKPKPQSSEKGKEKAAPATQTPHSLRHPLPSRPPPSQYPATPDKLPVSFFSQPPPPILPDVFENDAEEVPLAPPAPVIAGPSTRIKPRMAGPLDSFTFAKPGPAPAPVAAPRTPEKQLVAPANPPGTQICIPSQIDPNFPIDQLPAKYREQYLAAINARQLRHPPVPEPADLELPPNSQYLIGDWNKLPKDVRDDHRLELEREHKAVATRDAARVNNPVRNPSDSPHKPAKTWQPLLAGNSPRKNRTIAPTKGKAKAKPKPEDGPVYDRNGNDVSSWLFAEGGIDREVFWAIDDGSRAATVAQAVREREARHEASQKARNLAAQQEYALIGALKITAKGRPGCLLELHPGVHGETAVRARIVDWFNEVDAPDEGDIASLETWLRRVGGEGGDLWLAQSTVRWMRCVIGARPGWGQVVERAAKAVDQAAAERGIAEISI